MGSQSEDSLSEIDSQHILRRLLPLLSLAVAFFVIGRLRQYQRLRHFRGPPTSGLSWWWHSKAVLSGRCYEYYSQVNQKYGQWTRSQENIQI